MKGTPSENRITLVSPHSGANLPVVVGNALPMGMVLARRYYFPVPIILGNFHFRVGRCGALDVGEKTIAALRYGHGNPAPALRPGRN